MHRSLLSLFLPGIFIGMLQLAGCTRSSPVRIPPGGVYRSTSAGATFEQSVSLEGAKGTIASLGVRKLFRDSKAANRIYAALGANGIAISEHDGQSWRITRVPLASTRDILRMPSGVLVVTGVDSIGQGYVMRSLDDGVSWQTVLTVPVPAKKKSLEIIKGPASVTSSVVFDLELDPFNEDRIYAGSNLGTIFAGEQAAKTWRTLHTSSSGSLAVQKLIASPHREGEILIITTAGALMRVTQEGQSKIEVAQSIDGSRSSGKKRIYDARYISQFPDSIILGIDDGIVVTRDGGASWLQLGVPVEPSQKFNSVVVAVSPTNTNRIITAINNVLYRSEDGGTTWNTYSLGLAGFIITDVSINPDNASKVLIVATPIST